uniref:Monoglyceride lipase n=1 Tax=Callorhinchus milii TaxID=7868 RepID=V9KKM2_CALMI
MAVRKKGNSGGLGGEMPSEECADRVTPQGSLYRELPHIINTDGQYLFCRYWSPKTKPRALVMIMHGAGEHSGRYNELAELIMNESIFVFAHDHVGHGQSEGNRMVISNFQVYIRDCLQHIDHMKEKYPGLNIFLIGHSMGGAIAILTANERPNDFAGVMLIAPLITLQPETSTPTKVFLARLLNYVLPNIGLGSIDPNFISRSEEEVKNYINDPLNYHGSVKVSFAVQLLNTVARIEEILPKITWPFLLLHGEADKLCDINGSYHMYDTAPSKDRTLKVYTSAYHVLHKELPQVTSEVFTEIQKWIVKRL